MIARYFSHISFGSPYWLLGLLLLPLLLFLYRRSLQHGAGMKVSSVQPFLHLHTWRTQIRHLPFLLRMLAVAAAVLALARPQSRTEQQLAEGEGVDIVLCLDVSGSMTAQDFLPNRLEAAKKVAVDFINRRLTDRIAIVIFSGESFTQCPLTTDKAVLNTAVQHIRNGLLEDGTAIGDGLATSVDRLRRSKARSKIVILLTDGENNGGLIGPDNAREIAKTFGVKVYTIGVGTEGYAPFPMKTDLGIILQQQKVTIDEKLLTTIARETGGRYFRARDNAGLEEVYREIDQMEKSVVQLATFTRYTEHFYPFALAALLFLLLEWLLRFTILRKFP